MLPSRPSHEPYQCFSKPEYFRHIAAQISQAGPGDHVLLASMTLGQDDPLIAKVLDALAVASQQGADVTLLVDARSFLLDGISPGPLWLHSTMPPLSKLHGAWQERAVALNKLKQAGCLVHILNQPERPFSNPFGGRAHIKTCVINDEVYIGGCNLDRSGDFDLMLHFRDAAAATWIREHLLAAAHKPSVQQALSGYDQRFPIDGTHALLLDAGVPGQSLIFEQALRTIDAARDWLIITCQYIPTGVTATHLKQAMDRGVQVRSIFNNPRKLDPGERAADGLALIREKLRMPPEFFSCQLAPDMPYMHAKLIASEQELLLGSHNYIQAGVRLGTAELTLHAVNPELSRQVARKTFTSLELDRAQQFEFLS